MTVVGCYLQRSACKRSASSWRAYNFSCTKLVISMRVDSLKKKKGFGDSKKQKTFGFWEKLILVSWENPKAEIICQG